MDLGNKVHFGDKNPASQSNGSGNGSQMSEAQKFYFTFMMDLNMEFSSVGIFWPYVERKTSNMIVTVPRTRAGHSGEIWDIKFVIPTQVRSRGSSNMNGNNMLSDQKFIDQTSFYTAFDYQYSQYSY